MRGGGGARVENSRRERGTRAAGGAGPGGTRRQRRSRPALAPPGHLRAGRGRQQAARAPVRGSGGGCLGRGPAAHCSGGPAPPGLRPPSLLRLPAVPSPLPSPGPSFPRQPALYKSPPPPGSPPIAADPLSTLARGAGRSSRDSTGTREPPPGLAAPHRAPPPLNPPFLPSFLPSLPPSAPACRRSASRRRRRS